jgi:hypothetical protein
MDTRIFSSYGLVGHSLEWHMGIYTTFIALVVVSQSVQIVYHESIGYSEDSSLCELSIVRKLCIVICSSSFFYLLYPQDLICNLVY